MYLLPPPHPARIPSFQWPWLQDCQEVGSVGLRPKSWISCFFERSSLCSTVSLSVILTYFPFLSSLFPVPCRRYPRHALERLATDCSFLFFMPQAEYNRESRHAPSRLQGLPRLARVVNGSGDRCSECEWFSPVFKEENNDQECHWQNREEGSSTQGFATRLLETQELSLFRPVLARAQLGSLDSLGWVFRVCELRWRVQGTCLLVQEVILSIFPLCPFCPDYSSLWGGLPPCQIPRALRKGLSPSPPIVLFFRFLTDGLPFVSIGLQAWERPENTADGLQYHAARLCTR